MAGCGAPYDRGLLEAQLVQHVRARALAYQLQDLQCTRDKRVKVGHLAETCACGGRFACRVAPERHGATLRLFANIAAFHDMPVLGDVVAWLRGEAPPGARAAEEA